MRFPLLLTLGLLLAAGSRPWAQDKTDDQERAITYIKDRDGNVEIDEKIPGKPVVKVTLQFTNVTGVGLSLLKGLTQVRYLDLSSSKVTDSGLAYLKGMTKLNHLDLNDTRITDLGLKHLKGLTEMETLKLAGTQISDLGLQELKNLRKVKTLDLSGTQISDDGLVHLVELAHLEKLHVGPNISDAVIRDLQRVLPKLKVVR
jgi:Leucine-rich repeat (LRR) protein